MLTRTNPTYVTNYRPYKSYILYNTAILQPYNPTTLTTALQPYNPTALHKYPTYSTILQHYNLTTLQLCLQPYSPTALQPYSPTALHDYPTYSTILQYYNTTTPQLGLQPYSPTTLQPNISDIHTLQPEYCAMWLRFVIVRILCAASQFGGVMKYGYCLVERLLRNANVWKCPDNVQCW